MPGCIRKTWTKTKQLMASHKMMLPLGLTYSAKIQWIVTFPAISLSHACVPLYYPLHEILHTYSESTERKLLIMPLPYSCRRMANFIYLLKNAIEKGGKEGHWKGRGFCSAIWQAYLWDGFSALYPLWPPSSRALKSKAEVKHLHALLD